MYTLAAVGCCWPSGASGFLTRQTLYSAFCSLHRHTCNVSNGHSLLACTVLVPDSAWHMHRQMAADLAVAFVELQASRTSVSVFERISTTS